MFATDIVKEWNRRQIQSRMEKAIYDTFGVPFNWKEDTDEVEKSGVKAVVSTQHTEEAKKLLLNLLEKLPDGISEKFDADVVVGGFVCYSKFCTHESAANPSALPNKIYRKWYKVNKLLI